jgi:hypothetical protein
MKEQLALFLVMAMAIGVSAKAEKRMLHGRPIGHDGSLGGGYGGANPPFTESAPYGYLGDGTPRSTPLSSGEMPGSNVQPWPRGMKPRETDASRPTHTSVLERRTETVPERRPTTGRDTGLITRPILPVATPKPPPVGVVRWIREPGQMEEFLVLQTHSANPKTYYLKKSPLSKDLMKHENETIEVTGTETQEGNRTVYEVASFSVLENY